MREYPKNCENNIIVEMYNYSPWSVFFYRDISDQVISYSYECDYNNNVRQTASITLKVKTNDQTWYMRRENKMSSWSSGGSHFSISWDPVLYKLTKVYKYPNGTQDTLSLGYFIPVDDNYTYDSTTGTISISLQGLSAALTKEYGGSVLTYREGKEIPPNKDNAEGRIMIFPTALFIPAETDVDGDLFKSLVMGSNNPDAKGVQFFNATAPVPITYACVDGTLKAYQIPYDLEFDIDIGRMDIIEEVLDVCFINGHCYIDEDLWFHAVSYHNEDGSIEALWSDYGNLFISESNAYNDSGMINVTEVFGKDNQYYAICDESHLDGGMYIRKQVLHFDELQSDEECQMRAELENHIARFGRQSLTVTIADRYISNFKYPSRHVGNLIEYKSVDGDMGIYRINKISYGDNTIKLDLTIFNPTYGSQGALKKPCILGHDVINNNTLRIYVGGEDILRGDVKVEDATSVIANVYIGEIVTTYNQQSCKFVDIPIYHNGTYEINVSLFSPYYESSPVIGAFDDDGCIITVTELVVPAVNDDPDTYPHPGMFEPEDEHSPYLVTQGNQIITTEDGTKITI